MIALLALAISVSLSAVLGPVARSLGLVDEPDGVLKNHRRSIPITGGIAIFISVMSASAAAGTLDPVVLLVAFGLLAVGVYDDLRGLPPLVRLAAGGLAGGTLAFATEIPLTALTFILTVVLVATAVNAVNLLDGADGVAAVTGFGTAIGLSLLTWSRGVDSTEALIVAGAIGGFLIVNWPEAKAFLGDGGAYVIGGLLSLLALRAQPPVTPFVESWLPLFIASTAMFGGFFVDLLLTMARRLKTRSSLLSGDRLHVYDRLRDMGWSPRSVAVTVGGAQGVIVTVILFSSTTLEPWYGVIVSIAVLMLAVIALWALGFGSKDRVAKEETL